MTVDDEKIEEAFLAISAKAREKGVDALSPIERAFRDANFAWGLASNGGLHGLLFRVDDTFDMGSVVEAYHEIGVPEAAQCVVDAGDLLLAFFEQQAPDVEPDADAFRKRYSTKLNAIERRFYTLEASVRRALCSTLSRIEANST